MFAGELVALDSGRELEEWELVCLEGDPGGIPRGGSGADLSWGFLGCLGVFSLCSPSWLGTVVGCLESSEERVVIETGASLIRLPGLLNSSRRLSISRSVLSCF